MRIRRPKLQPCQIPGCKVKEARYRCGAVKTCGRHAERIAIELTKAQAEWVGWALEGPIAEWDYPEQLAHDKDISLETAERTIIDRDTTHLGNLELDPTLTPRDMTLFIGKVIDRNGEFIASLLGMLEDVAPDVAGGYGLDEAIIKHGDAAHAITAKRQQAAREAARKIREALGLAE